MEWFWACSVVVSGLALLLCSLCILGPFWIWLKVMLEDWHKPAAYTLCAGGGMPRSSDESPEEVEGLLLTCNLSGNEEEDHVLPAPWVIVEEDKDPEHQEQVTREQQEHLRELIRQRMKWEGRQMVVLPLVPLIAAPWTTCTGGIPTWAYALYVPFLLKGKILEAMLMRRLKFTGFTESLTLFWPCPSKAFSDVFLGFWLWGPLEHLDIFTDGAMPWQAAACDPEATNHFVAAFEGAGPSQLFQPLAQWLGLSGLLALTFLFATALQQVGFIAPTHPDRGRSPRGGRGGPPRPGHLLRRARRERKGVHSRFDQSAGRKSAAALFTNGLFKRRLRPFRRVGAAQDHGLFGLGTDQRHAQTISDGHGMDLDHVARTGDARTRLVLPFGLCTARIAHGGMGGGPHHHGPPMPQPPVEPGHWVCLRRHQDGRKRAAPTNR
ncbi:unnamed protein product [Durusdinium trenchii]|uniref:Uncharacterized protein n=1 Tax=Durusdinium trenchii TaxID=1381693 RepID=A0ABP0SU42_9DINO